MDIAIYINKLPIRLTEERWYHISIGHPEIADFYYVILLTIESPEIVYEGDNDELIAVGIQLERINKFIVVVYKEISKEDGFIITAYLSNKEQKFNKKTILWKQ